MTDISTPPRTGTDLLLAMAALRRALRRKVGRIGGVADLTDSQRELVRLVRINPGVRIGQAANDLRLAPNTVSTLAGSLVTSGWLERATDPEDARSAKLRLTAMAEESVAEWRDRRQALLDSAVAALPANQRQAIEDALPAIESLLHLLEAN